MLFINKVCLVSLVLLLFCSAVSEAARAGEILGPLFSSNSGVTPPNRGNNVWLYTSIAADYDGARMLPHFIDHYLEMGVKVENFLVVVNHNPVYDDRFEGQTPVEDVVKVLDSYKIKYHLWLDEYSSERLYKIRLQVLNIVPLNDWIIHADSDELHQFESKDVVKYFKELDKKGINEVKGTYVDRVSPTGKLERIESAPGVFEQFPYKCEVIKNVANSRNTKAMAYKGYWRSDRGNHQVVRPAKAFWYFGPPETPGGKNRDVVDAEDLWPLSPYSRNVDRYQFSCEGGDVSKGKVLMPMPPGISCHMPGSKAPMPDGWSRKTVKTGLVHHFKWHAGVIDSIKDRFKNYKSYAGDALTWFKDSELLLKDVVEVGKIDFKKNGCKK